ncbi:hypothetical protein MBH78_17720 [Oceanimonas sp. NS1]|nr:hypothetical protein [Oceanimonas sp. NS1]
MAGAGLSRGRLAIVLVLLVGVICLGQRIGLISHCGQPAYTMQFAEPGDSTGGEGCSLSEQLLTKFWDHPDSLLLGLVALLSWWLAPPAATAGSHFLLPNRYPNTGVTCCCAYFGNDSQRPLALMFCVDYRRFKTCSDFFHCVYCC